MQSDVVVVGSGVGGATVALELAKAGKKVTIIEAGKYQKLGSELKAIKFYTGGLLSPGERSREGTELLRTLMVGGSSVVTIGNGVRVLEDEFKNLGIDLGEEFLEAERELDIKPTVERAIGERTRRMRKAAEGLGYSVKSMPKFVDYDRCVGCGNCHLGCIYGAKWTSVRFLGEAQKLGARLLTNRRGEEILHSDGKVTGVRVSGSSGDLDISADLVVLAAGGLGTPVILQKSGISEAGENLFADLFENTYGVVDEGKFDNELGMATIIDEFHEREGFILSPILETTFVMFLASPLTKKHMAFQRHRILGLMTKITDDPAGKVDESGVIFKPVTSNDRRKLDRGHELAREILIESGADDKSIFRTRVRAAHPGGTAGIGSVINVNQETEISGLFVSDASALPSSPGKPPVLTIVAISKRLAKKLTEEFL